MQTRYAGIKCRSRILLSVIIKMDQILMENLTSHRDILQILWRISAVKSLPQPHEWFSRFFFTFMTRKKESLWRMKLFLTSTSKATQEILELERVHKMLWSKLLEGWLPHISSRALHPGCNRAISPVPKPVPSFPESHLSSLKNWKWYI